MMCEMRDQGLIDLEMRKNGEKAFCPANLATFEARETFLAETSIYD